MSDEDELRTDAAVDKWLRNRGQTEEEHEEELRKRDEDEEEEVELPDPETWKPETVQERCDIAMKVLEKNRQLLAKHFSGVASMRLGDEALKGVIVNIEAACSTLWNELGLGNE